MRHQGGRSEGSLGIDRQIWLCAGSDARRTDEEGEGAEAEDAGSAQRVSRALDMSGGDDELHV